MVIFSNFLEGLIEIFIDDFPVFGDSFKKFLGSLKKVIKRCEETRLMFNWEKCYFMVTKGIVLGHIISKARLEVDPEKIDVVSKLPLPSDVKLLRNFLGHVVFYRRFIKGFFQIVKPLSNLLCADQPFNFDEKCNKAF